jgi:alpha-L-fucosidase
MDRRKFMRTCGLGSAVMLAPGLRAAGAESCCTGGSRDKEAFLRQVDAAVAAGRFRDTWESLAGYQAPVWYQDAKFGIFIHWGVYSVPAYDSEWYPRNMYLSATPDYWHHLRKWGPQNKFGYKDFIPRFKAEKWDPDAWVSLFKSAGARYVVPVAEHHDGFAMYDCGFSDWTAAKMGPKRDTIRELGEAVRRQGLTFGLSSHRAEHWWFFNGGRLFNSDVNDPRYAAFYGPAMPVTIPPDKTFMDDWLARSCELVDLYRPQVFWFDWWIEQPAFEPYRKKFAAFYYNRAAEWGQEVVLNYKNKAFPDGVAVLDLERSGLAEIRPLVWQTDTTVSLRSWGYIDPKTEIYKDAGRLVGDLVDIVSKNGVLLLNVGPAPDGTLPEPVKTSLAGIGRWLQVNGEAVYGSRPWRVFGEGPTTRERNVSYVVGEFFATPFTARDFRFTQKGDALYAFVMNWPTDRKVAIKSLGRGAGLAAGEVSAIRLLGDSGPGLKWTRGDEALSVTLPEKRPGEYVSVLEIKGVIGNR